MKKLIIGLTLLLSGIPLLFSQTAGDTITMKKAFGGYQFFINEKRLTVPQVVKTMEANEQAYKTVKGAQASNGLASVLSGAGGFMVGWPLGTALAGGDPNWALAGIGAGLIIVSIPVSLNAIKQFREAVRTYNLGVSRTSVKPRTDLRFALTGYGPGIVIKF